MTAKTTSAKKPFKNSFKHSFKQNPIATINAALQPLDELNFYLRQHNLSHNSPRHVILSQLWMLQGRLAGEWDRLQLRKHPAWLRLFLARQVRMVCALTCRRVPSKWRDHIIEIERNLLNSLSLN
ncbi:MAG: hypothetical protein P8144_04710 [Gammaproteobacteria bacterium]